MSGPVAPAARPAAEPCVASGGHPRPSEFIDRAEECGLVVDLGARVVREPCRQGGSWLAARAADGRTTVPPTTSVDISPDQLSEPGSCGPVASVLEETGYPADRLWLEITEGIERPGPARELAARGRHLARVRGSHRSSAAPSRWVVTSWGPTGPPDPPGRDIRRMPGGRPGPVRRRIEVESDAQAAPCPVVTTS